MQDEDKTQGTTHQGLIPLAVEQPGDWPNLNENLDSKVENFLHASHAIMSRIF